MLRNASLSNLGVWSHPRQPASAVADAARSSNPRCSKPRGTSWSRWASLYRRWTNKDQLVFAAIERYSQAHPVEIPDTGSLRGDLLALLTGMSRARATFMAVAAAAGFSGLLTSTGLTPAQAREKLFGDQRIRGDQIIYRRAHDRGEIDLGHIPPAVLTMPFDLVRHDLLMNLEPVKPARITSIVDEIFLPLVTG